MANTIAQSKTSERVKLMKQNFLEHRKAGKTISEIAEMFGVSSRTIYNNLQEIADYNNVSREDLLYRIHKEHIMSSPSGKRGISEHINPSELQKNFSDMLINVECIISNIDDVLQYENDNKEEIDNE